MKKLVVVFALVLVSITAMALKKDPNYLKARREGAEAQLKVCVVNDAGEVVSNASIKVFMGMNFRPKGYWINGKTDKDGVFVAKGKTCGDEMEIFAEKEGFYNSRRMLRFAEMGAEHEVVEGKWLPYGETEVLQLRRIHNPVALHSFGFGAGRDVPATNTWIGVDMAYGDFIKPYGKGEHVDFEVMVEWDGRPPIDSNYCVANMRFVEQLSGGYYAPIIRESEYPYVYGANENDSYDVRHVKVACRGNARQGEVCQLGNGAVLVTRTRCVLDVNGNLKSACYGFIRIFDADASWEGKPTMRLACVFNPTHLEDVETAKRARRSIRQCEPQPPSAKKRKSFRPF